MVNGSVVLGSDYRTLQNQVRELHRLLGKKTLEAEILKEALEHATGSKTGGGCRRRCRRTVPDEDRRRGHRGLSFGPCWSACKNDRKKRIGRPPLPDEELVAEIKAAIAELLTDGVPAG